MAAFQAYCSTSSAQPAATRVTATLALTRGTLFYLPLSKAANHKVCFLSLFPVFPEQIRTLPAKIRGQQVSRRRRDPAQLGQKEARPLRKKERKQDQPPLPVPTAIRGSQRSPAPKSRNPGCQEASPTQPGASAPRAEMRFCREGAPGSRPRGAAHGRGTAQAPRASLRGAATHNATNNPPTQLRTGFPGTPRRPPCPGLGAGGATARGRSRSPNPNPDPAPATHPPLPRAPAAPLRRYRESQRGAHRARAELPPTG
ncbi:translation initiation factor IF-2-like [Corvus kubaryi]|uniref:translation initiation factor IF-2-like n=1 Tax=Corvus kubaryi TaxID=68294 RepID=UPI001C049A3E|nr:translation initiation factor IF-2-like [Corvus kubaryi]